MEKVIATNKNLKSLVQKEIHLNGNNSKLEVVLRESGNYYWLDVMKYFDQIPWGEMSQEDVEFGLNFQNSDVKSLILMRKDFKLSQPQMNKLMKDQNDEVRLLLVLRPEFLPDDKQIELGLKDKSLLIRTTYEKFLLQWQSAKERNMLEEVYKNEAEPRKKRVL